MSIRILSRLRHLQPFESRDEKGETYYPTRAKIPRWFLGLVSPPTASIDILDVARTSSTPSFNDIKEVVFGNIYSKKTLDTVGVLSDISSLSQFPVDNAEIVPWMRNMLAELLVLRARASEYNSSGEIIFASGDGYPGVYAEDIYIAGTPAYVVRSQGYVTVHGPAPYRLPAMGKADGIAKDHISWAGMSRIDATWQHVESLIKWRSLASTPIRRSIGFYMDSAGHTAPIYVVANPPIRTPTTIHTITISTNKPATLNITFRDVKDYTKIIAKTNPINLPAGTTTIKLRALAIPFVPPMVAHLSIDDNTQAALNSYTVTITM